MRIFFLVLSLVPTLIWGARTTLSSTDFSIVLQRTEGELTDDIFGDELVLSGFKSITDVSGNTLTAWTITNGFNVVVQAAFKPAAGAWQMPGTPTSQSNVLSPLGFSVSFFNLDIDDSGNAIVAWEIFNGTHIVAQAAYKPFGGAWQTPGSPTIQENILSQIGFSVTSPIDVAIGANNAVVVWETNNSQNFVAQAAFKPPGGIFQRPGNPIVSGNNLSSSGFNLVSAPKVDIDNIGNVAVVWQINNIPNNVAQIALKPAGGVFQLPGNPQIQGNILSPLGFNLLTSPVVTIVNNQPVVQWLLLNGLNIVLQAFD